MSDVTSGLEGQAARAIGRAMERLFGMVKSRRGNRQLRDQARTLPTGRVAAGLLEEMDEAEIGRLDNYLTSPDFEELALQFVLGRLLEDVSWDELATDVRHELSHGLRNSVRLRTELLTTASDV